MLQKTEQALREPVPSFGRAMSLADEAGMATVPREIARDEWRDFIGVRQVTFGQERIVTRVEQQGRHRDVLQPGSAIGLVPVIVGIAETMQRRCEQIVVMLEIACL